MRSRTVFIFMAVSLFGGLLFNLASGVALAGDDDITRMKQRLWANPAGMSSLTPMPDPSQDALSLMSSASPVEPLDIGHAGIITFQSFRDGNWNIYTAEATGLEPQPITNHEAADIRPRLTLDSSRIAFSSDREGNYDIYVIDTDGVNLQRLTDDRRDEVYPDWSPDGGQIVYSRMRSNDHLAIYKMNADGSGQQSLASSSSNDNISPTWSPDGQEIAWIKRNTQGWGQIRVMDADSSNEQDLTEYLPYIQNPRWSPNGSFIAFDYDVDNDYWNEIVVLDISTGDFITVYDPNIYLADAWMGSWSPDGRYILSTLVLYEIIDDRLYLKATGFVRVDLTNGATTVLPGSGVDMHPDWQQTDFDPPISTILPLPAISASPFVVQWTGEDVGPAGIESFDVQVRTGVAGEWLSWHTETTATEAIYQGQGGVDYYFRVRAQDRAGHVEPWPPDYEAMTTVESQPPIVSIEPLPDYQRYGSYIQWDGYDPGGSGIKHYDVQYRMLPEAEWRNWYAQTEITIARFREEVAETYEVRIRASDKANNISEWSIPDDDTTTTLYTWMVAGAVSDNRARPLGELNVETAPPPFSSYSDALTGAYRSYVAEENNSYAVQWTKPGYLVLPLTQMSGNTDQQRDVVLPPPDNVIQNWGFEGEEPDSAWNFTGMSEVVEGTVHTGERSAQLGNAGIFGEVEELWSGYVPFMIAQNDGTVHMVFIGGTTGDWRKREVYYASRSHEGTWSSLQNISHKPGELSNLRMIMDDDGVLHVIWWGNYVGDMHPSYAARSTTGVWSAPESIPISAGNTNWYAFAIDAQGSLHISWNNEGKYVMQRSPTGVWGEVEQVTDHQSGPSSYVLSTAGDQHFAWTEGTWDAIYYRGRLANGTWTEVERLSSVDETYPRGPLMQVDGSDRVHVAWSGCYGINHSFCYRYRSPGEPWSATEVVSKLPDYGMLSGMKIDHLDRLHFAFTPGQPVGDINDSEIWYLLREADGTWGDIENVSRTSDTWGNSLSLAIDEGGIAHILWREQIDDNRDRDNLRYTRRSELHGWSQPVIAAPLVWTTYNFAIQPDGTPHVAWIYGPLKYTGLAPVAQNATHTLTQQIDIPAQLADPALSLLHRFHNIFDDNQGSFVVEIEQGAEKSTLLETSEAAPDWQHIWFDVSPWLGERVTVSFKVDQEMGAPQHWADLDEVTLGSSAYPDLWIQVPPVILPPDQPGAMIVQYGILGDHLAANTQITVTIPAETTVIESVPPAGVVSGQTLVWSVGDLVPTQATEIIELTLELSGPPPANGLLAGHVEIRSDSTELNSDNNAAAYQLFIDGKRYYFPLSLWKIE